LNALETELGGEGKRREEAVGRGGALKAPCNPFLIDNPGLRQILL